MVVQRPAVAGRHGHRGDELPAPPADPPVVVARPGRIIDVLVRIWPQPLLVNYLGRSVAVDEHREYLRHDVVERLRHVAQALIGELCRAFVVGLVRRWLEEPVDLALCHLDGEQHRRHDRVNRHLGVHPDAAVVLQLALELLGNLAAVVGDARLAGLAE